MFDTSGNWKQKEWVGGRLELMLSKIRRYHTLLAFTVIVGCSGAYVACGSDDEVAAPPATGGTGGVDAQDDTGSNGDAMDDSATDLP